MIVERSMSEGFLTNNYVVADDDCLAFAEALGRRLSARPPVTTAATRRLIAGSGGLPAEQDLERAVAFFLRTTDETRQAAEAYSLANPRPV